MRPTDCEEPAALNAHSSNHLPAGMISPTPQYIQKEEPFSASAVHYANATDAPYTELYPGGPHGVIR